MLGISSVCSKRNVKSSSKFTFYKWKRKKKLTQKNCKTRKKKEVDEDIGDLHSKSTSCLRE